jgi:hypothetical protein
VRRTTKEKTMDRKFHPLTLLSGAAGKPYANGKGSAPSTPDYAAAAQQTAAGNLEAAKYAAAANRVNQVTPYGNLTYTQNPSTAGFNQSGYDAAVKQYQSQLAAYNNGTSGNSGISLPNGSGGMFDAGGSGSRGAAPVAPDRNSFVTSSGPDTYTATTSLSPAQQGILDQTNKLNTGLLSTANSGLDYANNVLSHPGVDTSQLPQVGINPGQSYQDAMMARLQPQIDRENQQSDAQLANQGITQGSQAYNNAKTLLNQSHNDLLNNATVQGFNTGLASNQNAFQQQAYNQMQPINVINALRTGSQVQNPNFTNVPQQQATGGPDYTGAAQNTYNANLGASNAQNASSSNFTNGLMSLAGTAAMFMSDARLKTNIKRIGNYKPGIDIYSYMKFGQPEIGVLAQEVEKIMPHAVATHSSGYKMVDYGALK